MKKIVVFLTVCLTVFNGYAQTKSNSDYTYEVSNPYKVFDARDKFYFSKDNEVISLKFDRDNVVIQKFNSEKPSLLKEKKYEAFFPENYSVEAVLELNGKYFFFFSSWEGKAEKEQMFSVEIDFTLGEFVGLPKLMFQVEGKVAGAYTLPFVIGDKFNLIPSQDKKSLLIQYTKKPLVKDKEKYAPIVGLYTYDYNLNKISGNEVTMPYTQIMMEDFDYMLDNVGNIYTLAKVYHDNSQADFKKDNKVPNYHIELFTISSGSTNISKSKIDNINKFVSKLQLCATDKDFVVCAGYYSDNGSHYSSKLGTSDIEGVVYFKIKPDGTVYDLVQHAIPRNVFDEYEDKKDKAYNQKLEKENKLLMRDVLLRNITFDKDGEMLLTGEQYIYRSGGRSSSSTFRYNNILLVKFRNDNELAWVKKIPKYQYSYKEKGGMSYQYMSSDDNHYFVFLDDIKNSNLSPDMAPAEYSDNSSEDAYLMVVEVDDKDGSFTKKKVLNTNGINNYKLEQFKVKRVFKTSDSSFMFEAYKKDKEDVMIKVNLK